MSAIYELEKIERTETLTEKTYLSLRKLLMTGKLQPGEKITGRQIAKAMDVSLTPSREAIGRLVAEGALIAGVNQCALVPTLNKRMYKEISDCRIFLEGNLASNCIENFKDEDIFQIQRILQNMISCTDQNNFQGILQYNNEFHFKVYNLANMPIMLNIVENLWLKIGPTLNFLRPFYQETRIGIELHKKVVEAIKTNNLALIKKSVIEDINLATKNIIKLLKD